MQSTVSHGTAQQIQAEEIRSLLHTRTIGMNGAFLGHAWRTMFIVRGSVHVAFSSGELDLKGPCLVWLPWDRNTKARVAAGSVGYSVLLGDAPVANSVGHKPESTELRQMANRATWLEFSKDDNVRAEIQNCFAAILREANAPGPAFGTMVEAQTRIILLQLWRRAEQPDVSMSATTLGQRNLQQFRSLLEINFRNRWKVAQYATEIGISADRLHDTCSRTLGKSPSRLINERLLHEARLMLEQSTSTVDQIGAMLGFTTAAHFNRFFRTHTGQPPGQYRKAYSLAPETIDDRGPMSYSDWP